MSAMGRIPPVGSDGAGWKAEIVAAPLVHGQIECQSGRARHCPLFTGVKPVNRWSVSAFGGGGEEIASVRLLIVLFAVEEDDLVLR